VSADSRASGRIVHLISVIACTTVLAVLLPLELEARPRVDFTMVIRDDIPLPGEVLASPPESVVDRMFETILSDSWRIDYMSRDERGRRIYRERFWTANDPTPTTPENELYDEYMLRLTYALANFCPHDSLDWDERGDIALRFGVPPSRSLFMGDVAPDIDPPAEFWVYPRIGMSVRFIDPILKGWYQVGTDRKYLTDGRGPGSNQVTGPIEHGWGKLEAEGYRVLQDVPTAYEYQQPAEPLVLFHEVVTAAGPGGATDVAINWQVLMNQLSFSEAEDGGLRASIVKRIRILSADNSVLNSQVRQSTVHCECREALASGLLITDEWRVDMRPGKYTIAISVEDSLSGRRGIGRSSVHVQDYTVPHLLMSDIQLAIKVGSGDKFLRMGRMVVPKPVHAFLPSDELVIYFELYGLAEDKNGGSRFTITTEIEGREHRGHENWFQRLIGIPKRAVAVSSKVVAVGDAPNTQHWYSVLLSNLKTDVYDLLIIIKDANSKQEVSRTASFTVMVVDE
jgi:GWxTD domain-containing protein